MSTGRMQSTAADRVGPAFSQHPVHLLGYFILATGVSYLRKKRL